MPHYKILVAGAGIGGLTAASFLLQAGHDVEIYEQAPQLEEVGAGIQISANAMHALRTLGLESAITAAGVRPAAYVFRLHDTGEEIQRFNVLIATGEFHAWQEVASEGGLAGRERDRGRREAGDEDGGRQEEPEHDLVRPDEGQQGRPDDDAGGGPEQAAHDALAGVERV